ncbi:MAG: type IV secretion system protein [Anaplasma ovis]
MFRLLLIALVLLISGCGGVCIEPGKGVSSSSVEVKVQVQPPGASRQNPATYWVNSGYRVEANSELKLTVENTISLCPKDASTPATVRMFPEDFISSRPENEFYDTLLDVVKGDRVAFFPFLYDLEFPSCEKIGNEESFVIYYGNSDFYKDNACKLCVDSKDICSSGAYGGSASLYYKDKSSKCQEVPEGIELPKLGGSDVQTPRLAFPLGYMSKITKSKEHGREILKSNSKYMVATGRIHDGRTVKVNGPPDITQELCEKLKQDKFITRVIEGRNLVELKQNKNPGKYEKGPAYTNEERQATKPNYDALLREYTEYDISCNCGLICGPSDRVNKEDCTRSIVRVMNDKVMCPTTKPKKDINEGQKIDIESPDALKEYLDLPPDISDVKNAAYEIAEGAVAVISAGKDKNIASSGCANSCKFLPGKVTNISSASGGAFKDLSLKMHESYEVPESGRLFLSYLKQTQMSGSGSTSGNGEEASMQGFYTLRVHRTCYATSGKKLYMYIGEQAPNFLPGNGGSGAIELDLESQNPKGIYVINKKDQDGAVKDGGKSGYLYFGIAVDEKYDDQLKDGNYPDNHYSVRLWIPTWEPIISKFFALLQGTLLNVLYGTEMSTTQGVANVDQVDDIASAVEKSFKENKKGAIQQIYSNQVTSKPFWMLIQGVLTLYLMFSAVGYIMGVIKITKYDLAIRVAKVVFLVCVFSPGSWRFFNEHCFSMFIGGVSDIIAAFNGYLDGDRSFKFLDATLGLLLTSELWLRLLALIAAGPVGWLAFVGVVWALIEFFLAMFSAMITYLFSILAVAFLITLAPIFFSFILFQRTRQLFDGWLKVLMNFSLQPIIIFASLAFLNQMILTSLHVVTDFTACENCAIGINIPSNDPGTPNKPDICLLPVMLPIGFSNELSVNDRYREGLAREDIGFMGLPFGVAIVLMLILCCKSVREFVKISETIAHSISGSVASITASAMGATQAMLGVVGLDAASQQRIAAARGMAPPGEEKVQFESRDGARPMQEGADPKSPEPDGDGAAARAATQGVDDSAAPDAGSGDSAAGASQSGDDSVAGGGAPRVGVPDVADFGGSGGEGSPLMGDQSSDMVQGATSGGDEDASRSGVPDDVGVAHYEEVGADAPMGPGGGEAEDDQYGGDMLSGASDDVGVAHYEEVGADAPMGPGGGEAEDDQYGGDMLSGASDDEQSRLHPEDSWFDARSEWEDEPSPLAGGEDVRPSGDTGAADSEEPGHGAHHEDNLDDQSIAQSVGDSDASDSGADTDEVGRTDTTSHAEYAESDVGQDDQQQSPEEEPDDHARAASGAEHPEHPEQKDDDSKASQGYQAEFVDHLSGIEEADDSTGRRVDVAEHTTDGAADSYGNSDGEVIEEKLNKNPDNDTSTEEKQDKE